MKLYYYVLIMSVTNTSGIQPFENPHTVLRAECYDHCGSRHDAQRWLVTGDDAVWHCVINLFRAPGLTAPASQSRPASLTAVWASGSSWESNWLNKNKIQTTDCQSTSHTSGCDWVILHPRWNISQQCWNILLKGDATWCI